MAEHPSVVRPFAEPPPLSPRPTMAPYEPCWCRSGKKWKWCHNDREKQPQSNVHERLTAMRAAYQRGYCSHPDANATTCSEEIVRSHTVQRSGGLTAISENGHVVSALSAAQDIFKNCGELVPREVGVRSASTFLGFCGHHDTAMFRPAEIAGASITQETAFLLSFRAVAYELFMKRVQINTFEITREADKGLPFAAQIEIQSHLYYTEAGARLGLADLERWKNAYDNAWKLKHYDRFSFVAVAFSQVLPVVGCGGFHPEYDFAGRILQRLGRGPLTYELVVVNLTVLDGKSVAVIGWTDAEGGPASQFARSFAALPDQDKAEAMVRLVFEHTENVYMRPSWWAGLSPELKQAAIRRMGTGSAFRPARRADCLLPDGLVYLPRTDVVGNAATGATR